MPLLFEIAAHVERWVGPIQHVHHERASQHVHVDVLHVPPRFRPGRASA